MLTVAVCVKKMTPAFGAFFKRAFAAYLCWKLERLLLKSARFMHTHVSEMLSSFSYGPSGAAFVSSRASL